MVTYPSDWDVVELGSKCNITSSKRVFEREWKKSGIPFLRTRDIASFHSGEEQKDKLYISEETYQEKIASSGEPHKGDLLVTGVGTIGLPYLIDTDDRIYFKDGNILWMKKSEAFFPQWLYLQFLSKEIQKQITDGSGFTTVGTFTIKNAKKLNVPMPSVPEQAAVAETLSTFDTYIDDLAELIEKQRGIRDGAVKDLVSGKDRLDGFTDEWHESALTDIGTFLKGASLSKADIASSGTPFILYGELYTTYNEVTYKAFRRTRKTVDEKYYSRVGDVIIPTSGETAEEIATSTCVMIPGVILAGDLNIYRTVKMDGRFLSFAINHVMNQKILETAQGISIVHIHAKELGKLIVKYPSIPEQTAIADILQAMDEEIEALEIERDKMIQIREGAMDDLLTGRVRLKV